MLDLLKKENVNATFFINGNNFNCIFNKTENLQRAVNEGHQLASHTWSHPNMTKINREEIIYQMKTLENAMRKIVGLVPRYMRLPFGEGFNNELIMKTLGELDYTVVQFNLDSGDGLGISVIEQKQRYIDAVNNNLLSPFLILSHETKETTIKEVVPFAIDLFKNKNYTFLTVAECLGNDIKNTWFKEQTIPSQRDKTWVCTEEDKHIEEIKE
ncbi:polysaccharide deacetylase family protein [endosymbiont GvMRE of Glomus versiforme]|uniref:polysaccharide deacetylase family protein n=1 Tax=endosymbiont GvMRE of Glomus versiforme TaxID=2039283 RepID=UPI0011C4403C|nr:polysaccharide deacetylase family protein [endosymbiont GvMRE of Glomus versiforme]